MSEQTEARLREIQKRIETAAASASTRAELVNLRALWGDIERTIDADRSDTVD